MCEEIMKTILEVIKLCSDYLQQRSISNARREAEQLIADALDVKRLDLYLDFERPLTEEELAKCRLSLARRGKGEPAQYIRGKVDFFDCTIKVTPAVLIPRHETEILVDKIAKELEECDLNGKVLWDVCCGSGCIGISLKKRFPMLSVLLSDLSLPALEVARENALANAVDVEFLQGDLLSPFVGRKSDYLVCNPPYISQNDYLALEREVRDFEPRQALVAGDRGDEIYQMLSLQLPEHLNSGAKVWFEIGTGQGNQVKSHFESERYRQIRIENDWAAHERFFFLEIE